MAEFTPALLAVTASIAAMSLGTEVVSNAVRNSDALARWSAALRRYPSILPDTRSVGRSGQPIAWG